MAKPDKIKMADEQAILDMGIRTVAVAVVAHAASGTQLINYPDQFLAAAKIVAQYIKTGKH
jgi:hypothetical protein